MPDDFTGLLLDSSKILDSIKTCPNVTQVVGPTNKGNATEYEIHNDLGTPVASLHIYARKDGTFTIQPKVGKNQDFSATVAAHVKGVASMQKREPRPLSLKFISPEHWQFLKDALPDYGMKLTEESHKDAERHKVLFGVRDEVYIHRFHTGKFLLQGRPLNAFNQVVNILAYMDGTQKELVEAQLETFPVQGVTSAKLLAELDQRMPSAYTRLNETIKCIFAPSLALAKLEIDLPDYSAFAHPALRGLEGCLKDIFCSKGVAVERKTGVGAHFDKHGQLQPATRTSINCAATAGALEMLYGPYNIHRHSLFHADAVTISTRTIDNQREAVEIVDNVIQTVEKAYAQLP